MYGFFNSTEHHKCSDCGAKIPKDSRIYKPRDDSTDTVILCMICVNYYGITS